MTSAVIDTTIANAPTEVRGRRLSQRVRSGVEVTRSRYAAFRARVGGVWGSAGDRLRRVLDLPTRSDMAALTERIDHLEAEIDRLTGGGKSARNSKNGTATAASTKRKKA